jgi:hypothetical protein
MLDGGYTHMRQKILHVLHVNRNIFILATELQLTLFHERDANTRDPHYQKLRTRLTQ